MTNRENPFSEAEKESLRFLERDFNQCFQQLRHIDVRMFDILKFMFSAYTLLIGFALGLYKYNYSGIVHVFIFVLTIGLLVGVFMFKLALRNRSYFVNIARYINEQRNLFSRVAPQDLKVEYDFFRDKGKPQYFDRNSLQIWLIFLIAVLNSVLSGVIIFLIFKGHLVWGLFSSAVFLFFSGRHAINYLKKFDKG